jgi:hypothetical protein
MKKKMEDIVRTRWKLILDKSETEDQGRVEKCENFDRFHRPLSSLVISAEKAGDLSLSTSLGEAAKRWQGQRSLQPWPR